MTFWQSEEDFRNWVNSDAFKQGHAKSGTLSKEVFSKPSHLETFETFLDTKASSE
jgi:heme-degrading monooxygenase HmoA